MVSQSLYLFLHSRLKNNLQVCAVKAPGFGSNRKETMLDMAVSTGGSVLHDENGLNKLEDVNMEQLGSAKEVVITKDDTLIMKVSLCLRLITLYYIRQLSEHRRLRPCKTWVEM